MNDEINMNFKLIKGNQDDYIKYNGLKNIIEKDIELIREDKLNYYMVYLDVFATDFLLDTTNNSIDLDKVNLFKMVYDKVFDSLKKEYGFDYISLIVKEDSECQIDYILNEYNLVEKTIVKQNDLFKQVSYKIEL